MATKALNMRSSVKGAGRAPGFVMEYCRENGIADKVASSLCVVLDELLPSLVTITTSPRILLELWEEEPVLYLRISHQGEAYDLAGAGGVVWPESRMASKPGVLNMKIVSGLLDRIECVSQDGNNVTTLVRSLAQGEKKAEG